VEPIDSYDHPYMSFVYNCVLLFLVFLCIILCFRYGYSAYNEDIVNSRCGGEEPCSCLLKKKIVLSGF